MKRFLLFFFGVCNFLHSATINVTNNNDSGAKSFRQALIDANDNDTITFNASLGTITLTSKLPVVTQDNLTINTASGTQVIDGQDTHRLLVASGTGLSVSNCQFQNGLALGGTGGTTVHFSGSGGGGMGAGGALYVAKDQSVTLSEVTLTGNKAQGGDGGTPVVVTGQGQQAGGGGGGSFSSASVDGELLNGGGDNAAVGTVGGAGDGTGTGYGGGDGGTGATGTAGSGGGDGAGGTTPVNPSGLDGGYCGGGGGSGGITTSGGAGGGNGGGDGVEIAGSRGGGGGGGIGGGGGGGRTNSGANGAFGGGGGGFGGGGGGGIGGNQNSGGGGGGFGGGGGGGGASTPAPGGSGGSFGGDGNAGTTDGSNLGGGGGGGAGIGGAIFVSDGATLTLGDNVTITSNTVEGGSQNSTGTGGSDGSGFAPDIFLFREAQLVFNGTGTSSAAFAIQADQSAPGGHLDDGVLKQNTGTVTLATGNDYRGGTEITGGTLSVSADSCLGNASGNITLNGGTLNTSATFSSARTVAMTGTGAVSPDNSTTFTLSGSFSGANACTKSGSGILVLSGNNAAFSGGFTFAAGTTQASASNNLGSGDLTFNGGTLNTTASFTAANDGTLSSSGGTINVDPSTTLTLSGQISGAGALSKTGTGTLTLTGGSNDFTGGTTITTGSIALSGNGTLPALGAVANNATLNISAVTTSATIGALSGSGTVTLGTKPLILGGTTNSDFSGDIEGSGAVTKKSTGTQTFSSTCSYTGSTAVSAGTLSVTGSIAASSAATVSSGAKLSTSLLSKVPTLTIASGGTFELNHSDTQTLATNFLSGSSGNFEKAGSGILTLTATNNYTGSTTVSDGTLFVNGSIASSNLTTVASGGILKGTGTVGPLTVSGTHAPGASIGTQTVIGDLTYASGSNLEIEINAEGLSDLIIVTGGVTISSGATITVVPQAGDYQEGVRYTFLTAGNGITGSFGNTILSNADFLSGFNFLVLTNGSTGIIELINQTLEFTGLTTTSALTEQIASTQLYLVKQIQSQRIVQKSPCQTRFCQKKEEWPCTDPMPKFKPYILVDYALSRTTTNNHQRSADNQIASAAIGTDITLTDAITYGLQVGYSGSKAKATDGSSHLGVDSVYGATYLQGEITPDYYLDLALLGGGNFYNLSRSSHTTSSSTYDGYTIGAETKLSHPMVINGVYFQPSVGFDYLFRRMGQYNETGGTNRLEVPQYHVYSLAFEGGLSIWTVFCSKTWKMVPELFGYYDRRCLGEFEDVYLKYRVAPHQTFVSTQPNIPLNAWRVGAGLNTLFKNGNILTFQYQAKISSSYHFYQEASVNVEIKF